MAYEHFPISAEKLEPIETVAKSISAATSKREVFRALLLFAAETTPGKTAFVALYNPATGLRKCIYAGEVIVRDDGSYALEEDEDINVYPEVPLNAGPQSQAILTGQVINTPDYDSTVAGLPRVNIGSDGGENPPGSSLAIPLGSEGRTRVTMPEHPSVPASGLPTFGAGGMREGCSIILACATIQAPRHFT